MRTTSLRVFKLLVIIEQMDHCEPLCCVLNQKLQSFTRDSQIRVSLCITHYVSQWWACVGPYTVSQIYHTSVKSPRDEDFLTSRLTRKKGRPISHRPTVHTSTVKPFQPCKNNTGCSVFQCGPPAAHGFEWRTTNPRDLPVRAAGSETRSVLKTIAVY